MCDILSEDFLRNPLNILWFYAIVLIPLLTVERHFWVRVNGRGVLFFMMLLDFTKNPIAGSLFILVSCVVVYLESTCASFVGKPVDE